MGHDRGNQISLEDFANGFTLFAFDLSPDLDDGGHFHLIKQGNVRLELHFNAALPETINVIVYAEFDNVIKVDKARIVLFDYSEQNSEQIECILSEDSDVSPVFLGVYPINRLPPIRNGAFVVNTATSDHPGLHWVAVWVRDDVIEYFDSYALQPSAKLYRWGRGNSGCVIQ